MSIPHPNTLSDDEKAARLAAAREVIADLDCRLRMDEPHRHDLRHRAVALRTIALLEQPKPSAT